MEMLSTIPRVLTAVSHRRRWVVGVTLGFASLALAMSLFAQTGRLDVVWFSIDGGGGTSQGGRFNLQGTTGQPDAGDLSGGRFDVSGGFNAGNIAKIGPPGRTCGDLSNDGNVNISDAILGLQIIVGSNEATGFQRSIGDVTRDGAFNVVDVIFMIQHSVELAEIVGCG